MKSFFIYTAILISIGCNNSSEPASPPRPRPASADSSTARQDSMPGYDYTITDSAKEIFDSLQNISPLSPVARKHWKFSPQNFHNLNDYFRLRHEASVQELSLSYTTRDMYLEILRRAGEFKKDTLPPFIKKNFSLEEIRHVLGQAHTLRFPSTPDLFEAFNLGMQREGIIIGNDNRREISFGMGATDKIPTVSGNPQPDVRCVMAIIYRDSLQPQGKDHYVFSSKASFQDIFLVCDTERFSKQPSYASGSGFVVDKATMITAAHCINNTNFTKYYFVLDYILDADGKFNRVIDAAKVFKATAVVKADSNKALGIDYAVITLDHDVDPDRIPRLNRTGKTGEGDLYYVIGTPCGIPLKLADSARIRENTNPNYFTLASDTYQGNSGSPVFNFRTHEIEGIIAGGDIDFKLIDGLMCYKSIYCPDKFCLDAPTGEKVSRVSQFINLIK